MAECMRSFDRMPEVYNIVCNEGSALIYEMNREVNKVRVSRVMIDSGEEIRVENYEIKNTPFCNMTDSLNNQSEAVC